MSDLRGTTPIAFVDTDTEVIKNSLILAYETIVGRTLYPADPARLFVLWVADIIAQVHVLINESARSNVPSYAKGEYLDRLCEMFKDVRRLPATAATTTLRFTLSEMRETTIYVPEGSRVTVDGDITFATAEIAEIPPGNMYVDVTAECLTIGDAGNDYAPGKITNPVDIFPYLKSAVNITTSEGGADVEGDDSLYERMRESMESYSTAGPSGAYEYLAKSVSSLIADVKAYTPEPGVVNVLLLMQGGQLPGAEIISQVEEALTDEKVRPMTDDVYVMAPDIVKFNIDVTYYIPRPLSASSTAIQAAAEEAVEQYRLWQTSKMGRDINPSKLNEMLMQAGVKRSVITAPDFTVVAQYEVAQAANVRVVNGGLEDE